MQLYRPARHHRATSWTRPEFDKPAVVVPLEQAIQRVTSEVTNGERDRAAAGLDFLSIQAREKFLKAPGMGNCEFLPWLFNREYSYLRRPLLIREETDGSALVVGPCAVWMTGLYLTSVVRTGRLHTRTDPAKQWMATRATEPSAPI